MPRILVMIFLSLPAAAQTQIDLRTQTKSVDFTAAASTKPLKTGSVLPATCELGDMFFKTDATPGANLYACTAVDTWSIQAGSVQGSLTVKSNDVTVGQRGAINFEAGPGIMTVMTDSGSEINVLLGLDTAVVQTPWGEQSGSALLCASTGGSSSSYQCSLQPTLQEYATGMTLHWTPDVNGAGGATTLNVDTLGATAVKLADGVTDPASTDIQSGQLYVIWYDGGVFRLPPRGGGSGADILRFGICITAGCGSEATINYIATMGAGSLTECSFNLAVAATGSSVIVDVQDGTGTSIFGATKLVVTVANGTAVEYQSTFANSPQNYARGNKYRAVVTQNDSGNTAQGGMVQCR